ncbi:hypothetical protein [Saccharopolyspora shandongensis]|uniref:hypothetical protein n=1 Tax=Saccharopolyspora shandongensis TaxID=418495 RepID=UPI003F4DE717
MPEYVLTPPVLEPAAAEFAAATADPPFLFDLGPVDGRKAVDEASPATSPSPPAPPASCR